MGAWEEEWNWREANGAHRQPVVEAKTDTAPILRDGTLQSHPRVQRLDAIGSMRVYEPRVDHRLECTMGIVSAHAQMGRGKRTSSELVTGTGSCHFSVALMMPGEPQTLPTSTRYSDETEMAPESASTTHTCGIYRAVHLNALTP